MMLSEMFLRVNEVFVGVYCVCGCVHELPCKQLWVQYSYLGQEDQHCLLNVQVTTVLLLEHHVAYLVSVGITLYSISQQ